VLKPSNETLVAEQSTPTPNQCDGCVAGHRLKSEPWGKPVHLDPKTGCGYMVCQKDKYKESA
jgi:hypothetical protein